MQLFEAGMTRREALRLSGLSFPAFLLPARAADSQSTAILTRPIPNPDSCMGGQRRRLSAFDQRKPIGSGNLAPPRLCRRDQWRHPVPGDTSDNPP